MRGIDLPNPLSESTPEVDRLAGAAFGTTLLSAAPVLSSSLEVMATIAPGMARDVIDVPAFLQRNPDNTFKFLTGEA